MEALELLDITPAETMQENIQLVREAVTRLVEENATLKLAIVDWETRFDEEVDKVTNQPTE